ncbi:MAG: alanine racemase [Chitinophagaceae bacterium]|nr:MAG: alanine racemase [Chitinophagaceae bacterium]
MKHTSYLEIDKSAFKKNLNFFKKLLGPGVLFSSVVKSNAYGHGIKEYVTMAKSCGVKHFSVFSAHEAQEVIETGVCDEDADIMIMGYLEDVEIKWAIEQDIEIYIFHLERLKYAIKMAEKLNKKARIHIEVETGLNRTGIDYDELDDLIPLVQENADKLILKGLCTHFGGAESIGNYFRIMQQIETYKKIKEKLSSHELSFEYYHQVSSAGVFSYPEAIGNMVRIGIAQYGLWPSREVYMSYITKNKLKSDPLKRLISWKSKVMEIKNVKAGDFVGYGMSYMAPKNIKVALVPVGYAYGYSRSLSNLGRVLLHGRRIGVIGTINMNMMAINITDVPNVNLGDEVVLVGRQGRQEISIGSFGEMSNQLNYELLSRLPTKIPRYIIEKQKPI